MKTLAVVGVLGLVAIAMLSGCAKCCGADLPASDAGYHQLIIVEENNQISRWFESVPELAGVKRASLTTKLDPSANGGKNLFTERYKSVLGTDYPIVAYLRPDGGVIYFADSRSMPAKQNLFAEMKTAWKAAKNARPSQLIADQWQEETEDCLDGSCDPRVREPIFPRLNPLRNPMDDSDNFPMGGWFSDSISSGIALVFGVVAMGCVMVFALVVFALMWIIGKGVMK